MITREDADTMVRGMGISKGNAGLAARFSEGRDRMEICIFTATGRPISVADIVSGLAHFVTSVIKDKLSGELKHTWGPDEEAKPGKTPGQAQGIYWGG